MRVLCFLSSHPPPRPCCLQAEAVKLEGPNAGVASIMGWLRSKKSPQFPAGIRIGEHRIRDALRELDYVAYADRFTMLSKRCAALSYHTRYSPVNCFSWHQPFSWLRRTTRREYYAPYFLYTLHTDMNLKLQEINIYFSAAIDGATRTCGWCASAVGVSCPLDE